MAMSGPRLFWARDCHEMLSGQGPCHQIAERAPFSSARPRSRTLSRHTGKSVQCQKQPFEANCRERPQKDQGPFEPTGRLYRPLPNVGQCVQPQRDQLWPTSNLVVCRSICFALLQTVAITATSYEAAITTKPEPMARAAMSETRNIWRMRSSWSPPTIHRLRVNQDNAGGNLPGRET